MPMRAVICLAVSAAAVLGPSAAAAAVPTKASWASGANRICRLELDRIHALQRPAQGDVAGTVAYLQKAAAISNPLTKQIAALPRPASEATPIKRWLGTQWEAMAKLRRLSDAISAHDATEAATLSQALTVLGVRADAIAKRLGATVCAQS
jgi:hypothetical protein